MNQLSEQEDSLLMAIERKDKKKIKELEQKAKAGARTIRVQGRNLKSAHDILSRESHFIIPFFDTIGKGKLIQKGKKGFNNLYEFEVR